MNFIIDLKRLENETDEEVIYRICSEKDQIGSWQDVANLLNQILGTEFTESKFRKQFNAFQKMLNANQSKIFDNDNYIKQIRLEQQEIRKEKQRLFDERLDLNRRLRETSRVETTIEKIEIMLSRISDKRYISYSPTFLNTENDLIVCLSDLHIGAAYYGFDGIYDSDIAVSRLKQYLSEIVEIKSMHSPQNCHLFMLGAMISGNIHHTISVTNKENVIEQLKLACEYISDFVYSLGQEFSAVHVYSVSGNHSRLEKKEDALLGERLDAIIPWFVKSMLKNCQNIIVEDKSLDDTLTIAQIRNKIYFAVHGDFDPISESSISKLALWAKITPYCVLCGHKHYPAMTEVSGIKVVQSGALGGSGDEFTRQKRLTGAPSQTVLVVNDRGIRACYPIEFEKT